MPIRKASSPAEVSGQEPTPADVANEFLDDGTPGGSGIRTRSKSRERLQGAGGAADTTLLSSASEILVAKDASEVPSAAPPPPLAPPNPQVQSPVASRQQSEQIASARTVSASANLKQAQSGVEEYPFDPAAFQRFLEFERQQQLATAQAQGHFQPRDSEPQMSADTEQRPGASSPANSGVTHTHTSDVGVLSGVVSTQPEVIAPRRGGYSEIVQVDTSPESGLPRSTIITVRNSTPEREHSPSVTSDDIPLIQLRSSANSGSSSGSNRPARSRVSWDDIQRGYSGHRCPVCGVTYSESDSHNPFTCRDRNNSFARTEAENKWLSDFSALCRAWRGTEPRQTQTPALPSDGHRTDQSDRSRPSPSARAAIQAVRRDEDLARRAGVHSIGGTREDIRDAIEDAAAESSHQSDSQSTTSGSASWQPSTSESSLSSYMQSKQELRLIQQELKNQAEEMRIQRQELQALNQQRHEWQSYMMAMQHHSMPMGPNFPAALQMPHPLMPHRPVPGQLPFDARMHTMPQCPTYPAMMLPYGSSPALSGNVQHGEPIELDPLFPLPSREASSQWHGQPQPPSSSHRPQHGGLTPAANHVEQAGMSGAPELAPEQLGKAVEFQKHVKVYNAYAIKAVSKGEPHLSLARTMAKHSFAIATAFTAQVIKRYRLAPHTFSPGDILQYTPQMVMDMPDDLFIRLYTESCSIAIEDPSQVYEIMSKLEYVRQTPEEDGPIPSLMRAEAAFRARLSLLPQHAVIRCRPQELRDAFIRMIFTPAKFDTMKLDFQQCPTWEHVYQQLTFRAGTSSAWYGQAPAHKLTPEVSVSPEVSSSSPKTDKPTGGKEASDAYWKEALSRLQRHVKHDPNLLEQFPTDKKKSKYLQKLKNRQLLESQIRDEIARSFDLSRRDSRDSGRERHSRSAHSHDPRNRPSRDSSQDRHSQDDRRRDYYSRDSGSHPRRDGSQEAPQPRHQPYHDRDRYVRSDHDQADRQPRSSAHQRGSDAQQRTQHPPTPPTTTEQRPQQRTPLSPKQGGQRERRESRSPGGSESSK